MTQHSNAYITTPYLSIDLDSLSTSSVDHTYNIYHLTKHDTDDILTESPLYEGFPDFDFAAMAEGRFDIDEDQMGFMDLPTSPVSMTSTGPGQESGLAMMDELLRLSSNADLHAAPWNMPMSHPVPMSGETRYLGAEQPTSRWLGAATGSSVPASSHIADSGYAGSAPQTDTASLVSAPSVMNHAFEHNSDLGEPLERPAKRAKKALLYCEEKGPHRTRYFTNIHDLERHKRSTHGIMSTHSPSNYFLCVHPQCFGKGKWWDRKDNFRSHIVRRHFKDQNNEDNKPAIDELVSRSLIKPTRDEVRAYHENKKNAKSNGRAGKRSGKQTAKAGRRSTSASLSNADDTYAPRPTMSPEPTYLGRDDFAFGGLELEEGRTAVPTIYVPRRLPDGPSGNLVMEAMSAPRSNPHPYSPVEHDPSDPSMGGMGMW